MSQTTRRRTIRGMVLAGALGSLLALSPVTDAQAATPGTLTLCSGGDFASYAAFPGRGGLATVIVERGRCRSFHLGGNRPERADVHVANGRYIGSFTYDGRQGANIRTVNGPSFYPF